MRTGSRVRAPLSPRMEEALLDMVDGPMRSHRDGFRAVSGRVHPGSSVAGVARRGLAESRRERVGRTNIYRRVVTVSARGLDAAEALLG